MENDTVLTSSKSILRRLGMQQIPEKELAEFIANTFKKEVLEKALAIIAEREKENGYVVPACKRYGNSRRLRNTWDIRR
jgi:hypothetical protein